MKQTQRKINRFIMMLALSILFGVSASFVLMLFDFRRSDENLKKTSMPTNILTITLTPTQNTIPTATRRDTTTQAPTVTSTSIPSPTRIPQSTSGSIACCHHCGPNKQPCGDSCISKNKTCHKPPGCACP
jgi:hypothetical protein